MVALRPVSLLGTVALMFLASAVVMPLLAWAYASRALAPCRIKDDPGRKVVGPRRWFRVVGNGLFSAVVVVTMCILGERWLVHGGSDGWLVGTWHTVAILLLYDFLYYFLHRFAFHQWPPLKRVHTVHHMVRHPNAPDALFLHPVENALGLILLFACIAALGPVSLVCFGVIITAHSIINIVVHCGLDVPMLGMRLIGFLARKHDLHHTSMRGGNFASITPFWDRLFGTAE